MADYASKSYMVSTGTDIYAIFENVVMTTAQGVSYSITRQKAPVYTLGSSDPRSIARSKRGIAGSMIMTTYDRHCLNDFITKAQLSFYAKKDEMANSAVNPYGTGTSPALTAQLANQSAAEGAVTALTSGITLAGVTSGAGELDLADQRAPMYADQILPFDVTLAAANEAGTSSTMRIYAVEFLNEGSGVSIDDTSNEVQLTYIARALSGWVNQARQT